MSFLAVQTKIVLIVVTVMVLLAWFRLLFSSVSARLMRMPCLLYIVVLFLTIVLMRNVLVNVLV